MSAKTLVNTAHQPGNTAISFSRDGAWVQFSSKSLRALTLRFRYIYTGGADSLVRVWKTELGTDQEPDAALDAMESITCLATAVRSL